MEVRGDLRLEATDDGSRVVMRDESGKVALRYSGLKVWDAEERELRAEMVVRGRRVSIEVEEEGAVYPLTIDPVIDTEVTKIQASDREAGDEFGISVSISGDTAIVGARGEDTGGLDAGAAYLFTPAATAFDVCIKDDSNPANSILLITTGPLKGTYRVCCGGQTFTGKGAIGIKNGVISLTHFTPTRRVQAFIFMNQTRGSAAVQSPLNSFPCLISDSDITDNTCNCPSP